jgi:hypothetical protein
VTTPAVRAGATAVIEVDDTTVNEVALTPLNLTEDTPTKFVPVMVTVIPPPSQSDVLGVYDVIVGTGGATTVNT